MVSSRQAQGLARVRQRASRKQRQEERQERLSALVDAQAMPNDHVWDELEQDRVREQRALIASELGSKNAGGAH